MKIRTYLALARVTGRFGGPDVSRCIDCVPNTADGRRVLFRRLEWRRNAADLHSAEWQILHLSRPVRPDGVIPARAVLCSEILRQALAERTEWKMAALANELAGRFERELDMLDDDLATIRV